VFSILCFEYLFVLECLRKCITVHLFTSHTTGGTLLVAQLVEASRKVAGSIPDGVTGIFH